MIVRLALLAAAAAACSGTQAGVVMDEAAAVDAQQAPPTTAASAAPAASSSTAPPATTAAPPVTEPTTEGSASAATSSTAPPTTTAAATDDDELAESSLDGFEALETSASAGRTGGAATAGDRLVLMVRCLTGWDDIYPNVMVRRQIGDPLAEWTEPASWQYRFGGSDEAVQVKDGWMSDAEIQAFIDVLALTDATQLHIDTYDADGAYELGATVGLADKHLAVDIVRSCQDT